MSRKGLIKTKNGWLREIDRAMKKLNKVDTEGSRVLQCQLLLTRVIVQFDLDIQFSNQLDE